MWKFTRYSCWNRVLSIVDNFRLIVDSANEPSHTCQSFVDLFWAQLCTFRQNLRFHWERWEQIFLIRFEKLSLSDSVFYCCFIITWQQLPALAKLHAFCDKNWANYIFHSQPSGKVIFWNCWMNEWKNEWFIHSEGF